jgi:pimeloyl-ACP methyl ester carboxylesterase
VTHSNDRVQRCVDVGSFRLAMECAGQGTPAVVLEAGGMATSAAWDPVWTDITRISLTCRYNRAGLGDSDRSPYPRTVRQMAAELHSLLAYASIAPPYVLVGHSFGVQIIRVFAGTYPGEVAGLVFVDGAHEDLFLRMQPYLTDEGRAAFLASWDAIADHPENLSAARLPEIEEGVRTVGRRLPDVPLTVLGSGHAASWEAIAPAWWPVPEFMRVHLGLCQELANLSKRGRLIVAERSGHAIHGDEPELVVAAIREIVETTRAGS